MTAPYATWQHEHQQDIVREARLSLLAMSMAVAMEADFGDDDPAELDYDRYPELLHAMREERQ